MQNVSNVICGMGLGQGRSVTAFRPAMAPVLTLPTSEAQPRQIDPEAAKVINTLFRELQMIFTAWRQAWPDDAAVKVAKAAWTKAFMAAGINTLEQVRFGVEQCRQLDQDFMPSPGRFIKLCQPTPENMGLPSVSAAYREAVANAHPSAGAAASWAHPAVYHAACETGFYELSTLAADKSRGLFERNYQIAVRAVIAGEPLRKMPLALPAEVSVSTPAVGRAALAAIRQNRGGRE